MPPLPPASPPLRDYWAKVLVRLREPILAEDDGEDQVIVGYLWLLGIRAREENVARILESVVRDGEIEWPETTWYAVDRNTLDETIRARIQPIEGAGVWYRSGRVFHPAEKQ